MTWNTGEKNKTNSFFIFIFLMLPGNCFGLYRLYSGKQEMLVKHPKLTSANYFIRLPLPVLNLIALTGMLMLKNWSSYLAIAGSLGVLMAEIYFGIKYHLFLAIPSTLILVFFIIWYRNEFK